MRLGLSSYTFTWAVGVPNKIPDRPLNLGGLLQKCSDYGINCLQVADNITLETLDKNSLSRIKHIADDKKVSIEVGMRGLTLERGIKYLELAEYLESPILRAVFDAPGFKPDVKEIINVIKQLLPILEERKIKLAIENHDRFEAEIFADIIESVGNTWVGICLDSVNSLGAGEGIATVVETLAPYTINLHIKDFTIKRQPHMMGFLVEGTPAGLGMLPIEWLMEKLISFGQCESAILELWTPPEANIEDTIKKEDEWAEISLQYLRNLKIFKK
ncbi:sugar phosphate isomerase/epimerase [soil metagenome]